MIKVDVNSKDWKLSKCSCSFFKKDYICSHMIGMSIRLGLCEAPLIAQNVEIGKHRGVGRPATIAKKSAWLDQPSYFSQFTSDPSTSVPASNSASAKVSESDKVPTIFTGRDRGRPPGSLNKKKRRLVRIY